MSAEAPAARMKRKVYEKELAKLQVELCHLQEWVKANKLRVIVLFEGRDAAGKGGTIKAITEKVSPRVFRVVDPQEDISAAIRRRAIAKDGRLDVGKIENLCHCPSISLRRPTSR